MLKSSPCDLTTGVPQGSVQGPILFILYTTPLSSLISSQTLPVKHHLYADDTQLFVSFSPSKFDEAHSYLQSTISDISNWMTANFLSLNPSKTEFLLIGLPHQLSKLNTPCLLLPDNTAIHPVTSARTLGIIFDSNPSFNHHIKSLSKFCFYHIRDLRRIRSSLNFETAHTIATAHLTSESC